MDRLRSRGVVVLLELDIESLERRIDNLATRGLVIEKGQTLRDLYRERMSLYKRWADVTIDCAGKNQDQVVAEILTAMPG
jgi:shikimate kinase